METAMIATCLAKILTACSAQAVNKVMRSSNSLASYEVLMRKSLTPNPCCANTRRTRGNKVSSFFAFTTKVSDIVIPPRILFCDGQLEKIKTPLPKQGRKIRGTTLIYYSFAPVHQPAQA